MAGKLVGSMAAVAFLVFGFVGCAPFAQYRTVYEVCVSPTFPPAPACESHTLQQLPAEGGANYLLGFVEFDDQGQLWDRKQMWAVVDKLSEEAASKDLLIVVFVHGWKHSAAPDDGNIRTFREVLARLSESEAYLSKRSGLPARQVAGIYLGWRGGSVTLPLVEELTFWERKNTAEKVGHAGVTEVLSRLELLKRVRESMTDGSRRTRLVVVGHSFGGAVVNTALAQILGRGFVRTTCAAEVQCDVAGFGDLVVLINPAFEALLFGPLSDMAAERGLYFKSQLPVVAVLTSEADYATRYAFPAGRWVSTLFENERDLKRRNAATRQEETVEEGKASRSAVGHFEPYRTHRLYPSDERTRRQVSPMRGDEMASAFSQASAGWVDDQPGSKIPFGGLVLERTATSAGRNPYLVVYVDRRLIADHNDIDDPRVIDFIGQLIMISSHTPEQGEQIRRMMGPPGSP